MLNDLKRILDRDSQLQETAMQTAAARLMARQFLLMERPADRPVYALLVSHWDYFNNLFSALGWALHRDDAMGLVGVLPTQQQNHAQLKLLPTMLLLVMRLLYEEGMDRFEVREGAVFVDGEKLLERYLLLFKRDRPNKTDFVAVLRELRQHSIIEWTEDGPDGLPTLRILPSVRLVTGAEFQERIKAHLSPEQEDDQKQDQDQEQEEGNP